MPTAIFDEDGRRSSKVECTFFEEYIKLAKIGCIAVVVAEKTDGVIG